MSVTEEDISEALGGIPRELTESEVAAIVRNELNRSIGYDSDELVGNRENALYYYRGEQPGQPMDGRSKTVSMDVADMVEALLSQIMPTFANDTVVEFEPTSPDDERQAQLESQFVNYVIMEQNRGFSLFYQSIKDALLQKNGIIKVYVDQVERVSEQIIQPADEYELAAMAQPQAPGEEVYAEETPQGIKLKRVRMQPKLCVESLAPEDFLFSSDQRTLCLQETEFCAHKRYETQTSLLEYGYDPQKVAEAGTQQRMTDTDEIARNQTDKESEKYYYQEAMRPIEIYECYVLIDKDQDGIAERRKVVISENIILEDEPADYVPFAAGTPFIMPHRFVGLSIFDKLRQIQDQKTATVRQYIDNMDHHNNRRLKAIPGQCDMEDVLNSRPAGVIKVKNQDAVQELPLSDIGPSSINLLNYLDQMRSERAGASLDMQAANLQVGAQTAHGVERQITSKELLAGLITRTLAETLIHDTYLLTHKLLRLHFNEELQARFGESWQSTNPAQWLEREQINVRVGMSVGERMRQGVAMQQIIAMQREAIANGLNGVLTDVSKVYNAAKDFARSAGISNPEQYFTDPQSPQAQEAAQRNAQASQQQQQTAQQQQAMMIQLQAQIEQMGEQTKRMKAEQDYLVKRNEQLRKWTELELEYNTDIPGQGQPGVA